MDCFTQCDPSKTKLLLRSQLSMNVELQKAIMTWTTLTKKYIKKWAEALHTKHWIALDKNSNRILREY